MRLFRHPDLKDALAHAHAGHQALCYTYDYKGMRLYDEDLRRLVCTARNLGVPSPQVQRPGKEGQNVLLTGAPALRAGTRTQQRELFL